VRRKKAPELKLYLFGPYLFIIAFGYMMGNYLCQPDETPPAPTIEQIQAPAV
jgi:hypothetical protein